MGNPYVISAELDLTNGSLEELIDKDKVEEFRESLDADLQSFGKETIWVPSSTIQRNLERAINLTNLPIVSLDERYVRSANQYIGISRGVDPLLNDDGYVPRLGKPSIKEQLDRIPRLGKEVVVADDVLFSGEMMNWLSDELRLRGVRIGAVIVGIAIQEGIDKLALEGINVETDIVFDEVEDEICERDFSVIPGSGRRIDKLGVNALYFDTKNGRPTQWASLPANKDQMQPFEAASFYRSSKLLRRAVSFSNLGQFNGLNIEPYLSQDAQTALREISNMRLSEA